MLRQHPVTWAEAPDMAAPLSDGSWPRLEASLGLDGGPARASSGLPTPTDLRRAIEAERLGDLACPEGTIAGLQALDDGLRHVLSRQRAVLEGAAREGFGSMRANVPAERIVARSNTVLGLLDLAKAGVGAAALPCFLGDAAADLVRLRDPDAGMATELWLLTHDDLRRVSRIRAVLDGLAGALQRRKAALEGSLV